MAHPFHNKKRAANNAPPPSRGIGYAGDARGDCVKRKKLQKQAQKNQQQTAESQQELLTRELAQMRNRRQSSFANTTKDDSHFEMLLKTLTSILRNQADWTSSSTSSSSCKLYNLALDCCQEISHHHPQLLGRNDDEESLLFALLEMVATAKIIATHARDYAVPVQMLAHRVLSLTQKASARAQEVVVRKDLEVVDLPTQYRTLLRPHAFKFVEHLPNHAYAKEASYPMSPSQRKTILKELGTYQTALPIEFGSSIFVRAQESRMDLLRVLILGPETSPYGNGCFFFDISLGSSYPHKPPKVKYLTTGGGKYRFNPNLYQDGKVCLSLLGTWSGPGWQSGESTLLQVLVSIQSLILVDEPYFNEPGYQKSEGTQRGTTESQLYNANIRRYTMDAAILPHFQRLAATNHNDDSNDCVLVGTANTKDVYSAFDDIVRQHFELKEQNWKHQLVQWRQDASTAAAALVNDPHRRYRGSMAQNKGPTMETLYFACLDAWDSRPRKSHSKKSKSIATAAAASKVVAREVNGVFEIDLDDDHDEEEDLFGGMHNIAQRSTKGNGKATLPTNQTDVIEIDLEEDDDNVAAGTVAVPQSATGSFTTATAVRSSVSNEEIGEEVIDLT